MSVPSHRSGNGSVVRRSSNSDASLQTTPSGAEDGRDDDILQDPAFEENGVDVVTSKDLPDCKVKRNYTCSNCDFFTQNPRVFLYHLRDVHQERVRVYECPNCLYASKHFQKLLRHTKMVHGSVEAAELRAKKRPSTGSSAPSGVAINVATSNVEEDVEVSPPDEEDSTDVAGIVVEERPSLFKCSVCEFTGKSQVSLTKHEKEEHIKTKFFRCTKCTYVTHIKARFTKHVKYHSMPMIKCDMCDFRTPYKWNLDRHCKNHNGNGAFRCSACNFTADIKQSLTVHEMNHHVPPVGQAAGLGIGRRRNKVGASDTTAAEEQAAQQQQLQGTIVKTELDSEGLSAEEEPEKPKSKVTSKAISLSPTPIPNKKIKTEIFVNHIISDVKTFGGSDFINPEDIIHHANGNIYLKNKCKFCNFKTPWATEMAKHEKKVHNIEKEESKPVTTKKQPKPIPNLIPITSQNSVLKVNQPTRAVSQTYPVLKTVVIPEPSEPTMSQKDINDICAKSSNSALKDLAALFGSEDVFKTSTPKVPDLIPAPLFNNNNNLLLNTLNKNKVTDVFKQKNASFFDNLRERLELGTGGSSNLNCRNCGHVSKCLTEHVKHQKTCRRDSSKTVNVVPMQKTSSSRCQFCRQRCKSSTDLYNHLQICDEAIKAHNLSIKEEMDSENEGELKIDEDHIIADPDNKPHPMENKVFVWNDIMVPMDIEVDDSNYEYTEEKIDDNVSLDLSVRTQSPMDSESSYKGQDQSTPNSVHHSPLPTTTSDKIPTHGNDISVAQHKRVFKCPHCTFWASTASRFHVHIVGHLNKKPFECSLCSYRSNWRWDITKHIKLKSVRDPAHESAKVLMTDETGRRNYTKYNKYLTEIPVSSEHSMDTSGGCGTRPKHHDRNSSPSTSKSDLPRLNRIPNSTDFSPLLKTSQTRPPPPLKLVDMAALSEKKKSSSDGKRTLFKCKKCNFKDASRDTLLEHVKGHYEQQHHQLSPGGIGGLLTTITNGFPSTSNGLVISPIPEAQDFTLRGTSPDDRDEASVNNITSSAKGGANNQAPFRCGHCNQVSNWKHVIQRHCRLKHSGDIRVVSTKNGLEKIEVEELTDEPDHVDVIQDGTFKCTHCPFSNDDHQEFEQHLLGHLPNSESVHNCVFCKFFVSNKEELLNHLTLHGINDPSGFLAKLNDKSNQEGDGKKFRCVICPYVTNSKSQYTYHKQFHKPRGGQYSCHNCSYNVTKRHLLHQHLKVHGINVTSHKQNGETISLDEITDEIEEVPSTPFQMDLQHFPDIPLVWVSKNGKFSKMFKCRYCPHVNLRKINIQEHEKMHSTREKNPNSNRLNDVEHRCTECNYICNNAGVLSSHSKVHQGIYGIVHCLVDPTRTDEEQIRELSKAIGVQAIQENGVIDEYEFIDHQINDTEEIDSSSGTGSVLYFCKDCPARFLKENEFGIHKRFHGLRLYYKCDYCTYTSREKPHLLSHFKVHTNDYQKRTKELQKIYITCANYPQPNVFISSTTNGEPMWVVSENSNKTSSSMEMSTLCSILNKPVKSSINVPLSGTDLFLQKSEAEQKHVAEMTIESAPPPQVHTEIDPENVKGNPNFIYPTTIKNGRMKEKRYKCHKCPSAFEKKEQYKVHLSLHGSKQRYLCEFCDYSVTNYANYVQHKKKHQLNNQAHARRSSDDVEDIEESVENGKSDVTQTKDAEDKKPLWCLYCPYTSTRKDAIDNHQKRHICVSGVKSNYTCEHCDYSVPQNHVLREHAKCHFTWNNKTDKMFQVEGFMTGEQFKLTSNDIEGDEIKQELDDDKNVIFEENASKYFLPPVSVELAQKFNNNDGEKHYVNVQTGEVVVKKLSSDMQSSNSSTNNNNTGEGCRMEVN